MIGGGALFKIVVGGAFEIKITFYTGFFLDVGGNF